MEAAGEAGGGSAVYDDVVEAQGQVEELARLDPPIHHAGLQGNPADGDGQREDPRRDPPTAAFTEHPDGSDHHRAQDLAALYRVAHYPEVERAANESRQAQEPVHEMGLLSLCRGALGAADLIVELTKASPVGSLKPVRHGDFAASQLGFHDRIDVDIVKNHQPGAPIEEGADLFVFVDGFGETVNDKSGKRKAFTVFGFYDRGSGGAARSHRAQGDRESCTCG